MDPREYEKKVDLNRRKPRQTRGTATYAAANKFALYVLAGGLAFGLACFLLPSKEGRKEVFIDFFQKYEEQHKEKKYLMNRTFVRQLTVEELESLKERTDNLNEEYDGFAESTK